MVEFPDSHRDLLQTQVAVLATEGADGYPQVSALWIIFDNGEIKLSLNTTRQKTKNLRRNPNCTLFLLDPANPYRTMEIRARAEIVPDSDDRVVALFREKYAADVRDNDQPGDERVAFTLHPVKINTWG